MKTGYESTRERRGLRQELRAYSAIAKILAVTLIILIGFATINRLDTIMTEQDNLHYQIIVIQQNIEEVKESIDSMDKVAVSGLYGSETIYHMPLTDAELDIVCRVVMSEAMGEPYEGMLAVAQVVRDRAISWGLTVTEVVTAPSQFAPPYKGEISDEVIMAVDAVFIEGVSLMEFPTTHFHADYVSPYWTADKVSRGTVGAHRFWY